MIYRHIRERRTHSAGQRCGLGAGDREATTTACGFANGALRATHARASMPQALEDRQAESFAHRRVHGERTIAIRLVEGLVADVTQPFQRTTPFYPPIPFATD